jgi:hypothetical protein
VTHETDLVRQWDGLEDTEVGRRVAMILDEGSDSYVAAVLCGVAIVLAIAAPIFIYRMFFRGSW